MVLVWYPLLYHTECNPLICFNDITIMLNGPVDNSREIMYHIDIMKDNAGDGMRECWGHKLKISEKGF